MKIQATHINHINFCINICFSDISNIFFPWAILSHMSSGSNCDEQQMKRANIEKEIQFLPLRDKKWRTNPYAIFLMQCRILCANFTQQMVIIHFVSLQTYDL